MQIIALDIESTGFEPNKDQVIEIAAVKFEGDQIIDRYETLINPGIAIPPIITHITSIRNEDVADAPSFAEIAPKLKGFLGDLPITGHNIDFDINFLNAKGMQLQNQLYDTLQLSTILLPGLPSYSLDTIGRIFGLEHEKKHRAMSDTIACYKLFLILTAKIREIEPVTFQKLKSVFDRTNWRLKELFLANEDARPHTKTALPKPHTPAPASSQTAPLPENFADLFHPQGKMAASFGNFEIRPSQQQMSESIYEAFKNNKKKIIEAGTGVGKTLAYLLASSVYSLQSTNKIVISTHTHNLQEQILAKDLPLIQQMLAPTHEHSEVCIKSVCGANTFNQITATILKGRKKYLSTRRLEIFMQKTTFEEFEVTALIKILIWLSTTTTGDLDEITFITKEYQLIDEICCMELACNHEDNKYKIGCFLLKARQKAAEANVIIVNHALLLQDTFGDSPILPEYRQLVIDEAHHLEQVATDALTIRISFFPFLKPFEQLKQTINHLLLKPAGLFDATIDRQTLSDLSDKTEQIISKIDMLFGFIGIFYEKNIQTNGEQWEINLSKSDLLSHEWFQVKSTGETVVAVGTELLKSIKKIIDAVITVEESSGKELLGFSETAGHNLHELNTVLQDEQTRDEEITWVYKSGEENVGIKRSPLRVSNQLQTELFNTKDSVILTSATLRTDDSFDFIRDQLGLDQNFEEMILPSHFSYPDQVKILIPQDLPEPNTEGYFVSCCQLIKNIILKNQGRTLVLFTSKKALAATYYNIAPALKLQGIALLAQNITGGRGKILQHFKDEPEKSALFGTNSFWEGVDLQGNQLNCVVIQKLPFDPPMDPIVAARSAKYSDGFNQYQLPRAILRFKQGFGRLIRSSTDTGSIIVLDSRIIQKSYGPKFLHSLPAGIKISYGTKNNLQELL